MLVVWLQETLSLNSRLQKPFAKGIGWFIMERASRLQLGAALAVPRGSINSSVPTTSSYGLDNVMEMWVRLGTTS